MTFPLTLTVNVSVQCVATRTFYIRWFLVPIFNFIYGVLLLLICVLM